MQNINLGTLLFLAAGLVLLLNKRLLRELAAQVAEALNNFPRGGPPTPMHPSPAGDDALLRRSPRSRKTTV